MCGDRGRADVECDPECAVAEARKRRDDLAPLAQGDRDLPVAAAQNLLQAAQHRQARLGFVEAPLRGERLLQPAEVAGGVVHVGLGDLDIMQPHHRIDVDRMGLGALAHDLAVHLALGRHVDDEIAARCAPGSRAGGPAAARRACRRSAARRRPKASHDLARNRCACLANSPSATSIWQRPQMPRPPQTELRSTPSLRAASSSSRRRRIRRVCPRGEDDFVRTQVLNPAPGGGGRNGRRAREMRGRVMLGLSLAANPFSRKA